MILHLSFILVKLNKKSDIISKTCFICKQIKTSDIIEQLNIDKSELGDDCKACIDSENL